MNSPKEDPADVAAREAEREKATEERTKAAQETAGDLTQDLSSVYGLRAVSMFSPKKRAATTAKTPTPYNHSMDR